MTPPLDHSLSALAREAIADDVGTREPALARGYLEAVEENERLREELFSARGVMRSSKQARRSAWCDDYDRKYPPDLHLNSPSKPSDTGSVADAP